MTPERRRVVAVIAAALVVVAVAVVIVTVGLVPLPQYPSLTAQPDPAIPGTVAFVRSDSGDDTCLFTVPAGGGQEREVACSRDGFFDIAWTDDGELVALRYEALGPTLVRYDPQTGAELDRTIQRDAETAFFDQREERRRRADGAELVTGNDDGAALLAVQWPDGSTERLLEVNGPRDYDLGRDLQWSPDGQWILLVDSRERMLVLTADGTPQPRLLAGGVTSAAWFIRGFDRYTVDPDLLDSAT